MAKALINKGIPIKADDPKDPYIRDASGINEIVSSNTTFGKSLALDSNGLKLKGVNGSIKSTVSIAQPYKEEAVDIAGEVYFDYNYDVSQFQYNGQSLEFQFEVGKCYKFWTMDTVLVTGTIEMIDANSSKVISIDCDSINDYISEMYISITAISGDNLTATGYTTAPTEKVYYNREIKLGDTIKVESNTIDANLPSYGDNLQLDTTTNTVNATNLCYLYTVSQFEVDQRYISIDPSASDIAIALWNQPLVQGTYYKLQVINGDLYASNTVTAVDSSDSSITFSINCSGINHTIYENEYLYIYVDSIDDNHYTCTGYASADVNTNYKKAIKVGDGLTINSDTLKATTVIPAYSSADSGKVLSVNSDGELVWITLS